MRARGGAFGSGGSSWLSRTPLVVVVLIGLTLVSSLLAALLSKAVPIFAYGAFVPAEVWHGEVWRLVTWIFLQSDPIGLLFACLGIYWFGGPLARQWGSVKFVLVYLALGVGSAAVTTVIGRYLWQEVFQQAYIGSWPVAEGIIIAWAITYPDQQILVGFVLPLNGAKLIAVNFVVLTLYAVYYGFSLFLPHYLASVGMLVYIGAARRYFDRWRLSRKVATQRPATRGKVIPMRRPGADPDDEPPPGKGGKQWLN